MHINNGAWRNDGGRGSLCLALDVETSSKCISRDYTPSLDLYAARLIQWSSYGNGRHQMLSIKVVLTRAQAMDATEVPLTK